MFGIKTRIYTTQLRRAVTIENLLKTGIFDHQIELYKGTFTGNEPTDHDLAVCAGAVNYIVAWDIEKQLKTLGGNHDASEIIHTRAQQILESDPKLERLVIRTLFDIVTLCHLLEKDARAKSFIEKHPRIMDVLVTAKEKHPDLFRDPEEIEFKKLFAHFIDSYLPDMKQSTSIVFS